MNHKVLLLNAGFSLYGLIQQNPTLKQQFALLGLNFGNEVMVNDRQQLIGQISQSVKNCRLLIGGRQLQIEYYTAEEMKVNGIIESIELKA